MWPFQRARVQLAHGEWLHQHRQNAASRAPLRAARETFDALGLVPWSERARQQLRATGETSRPRTPQARDQLTPQELQIVQLAAEGMSNREIGQRLYLSHRTVSSHLYRVFPKLGITSRAELPGRSAADRGPLTGGWLLRGQRPARSGRCGRWPGTRPRCPSRAGRRRRGP